MEKKMKVPKQLYVKEVISGDKELPVGYIIEFVSGDILNDLRVVETTSNPTEEQCLDYQTDNDIKINKFRVLRLVGDYLGLSDYAITSIGDEEEPLPVIDAEEPVETKV